MELPSCFMHRAVDASDQGVGVEILRGLRRGVRRLGDPIEVNLRAKLAGSSRYSTFAVMSLLSLINIWTSIEL